MTSIKLAAAIIDELENDKSFFSIARLSSDNQLRDMFDMAIRRDQALAQFYKDMSETEKSSLLNSLAGTFHATCEVKHAVISKKLDGLKKFEVPNKLTLGEAIQ